MWGAEEDPETGEPTRSAPLDLDVVDSADGQMLEIRPDQGFLADPDVQLPITIDPTVRLGTNQDTFAYSASPNDNTGQGGGDHLRVGWHGSAFGKTRTFIHFPTDSIAAAKHVLSAWMHLYQHDAYSCTASYFQAHRATEYWHNSGISWNTQPTISSYVQGSLATSKGGGSSCPGGYVSMPLNTALVKGWVTGTLPNYGLMLRASEATETGPNTLKTFASANHPIARPPYLDVNYNSYPAVPAFRSPGSATAPGPELGDATPTLSARFADEDGGTGKVHFQVFDAATGALVSGGPGTTVPSGQQSTLTPPTPLPDHKRYFWRALADDGIDVSRSWSTNVSFSVNENQYPPTPTNLSPANGATVDTLTPTLKATFSDPEGGQGEVDFEVRDDVTGALVASGRGSTASSGSQSSWTVPDAQLQDNKTYQYRARGYDGQAENPNWSAKSRFSVRLDQQAPTVMLSKPPTSARGLSDFAGEGLYEADYGLRVAAEDAGPLQGGVKEIRMLLDDGATPLDKSPEQSCPAGGCPLTHDFVFRPDEVSDGAHTVRVEVADQAGNVARKSWSVIVDRRGDIYRVKEYSKDPAAGGEQVNEQWASAVSSVGRSNSRGGGFLARDHVPCRVFESNGGECDETREYTTQLASDSDAVEKVFNVTRGASVDDRRLATPTAIHSARALAPSTLVSRGPLAEALEPWQVRPPASGEEYELHEFDSTEAVEGPTEEEPATERPTRTRIWIDAATRMPLKSVIEDAGGEAVPTFWTYDRERYMRGELPQDFFRPARPPDAAAGREIDYAAGDQAVGEAGAEIEQSTEGTQLSGALDPTPGEPAPPSPTPDAEATADDSPPPADLTDTPPQTTERSSPIAGLQDSSGDVSATAHNNGSHCYNNQRALAWYSYPIPARIQFRFGVRCTVSDNQSVRIYWALHLRNSRDERVGPSVSCRDTNRCVRELSYVPKQSTYTPVMKSQLAVTLVAEPGRVWKMAWKGAGRSCRGIGTRVLRCKLIDRWDFRVNYDALLRRYSPMLHFDSREQYWNASPATMTDHWENKLLRDGATGTETIFEHPSQGVRGWGLDHLVRAWQPYPGTNKTAAQIDRIDPNGDHQAVADGYRFTALNNQVYGRVARGGGGTIWLQYYLFYYYNSDGNQLIGEHEGDWESVQYQVNADGSGPIRAATYSQHEFHEQCSGDKVERHWTPDGSGYRLAPVAYVGARGHASYFLPGLQERAFWDDYAYGNGEMRVPPVTVLRETGPNWAHWPGKWGTSNGPAEKAHVEGSGRLPPASEILRVSR